MMEDDRVTSIIDTIDQAIADHETSRDAMRWTPNPPQRPVVMPQITPEQAAALRAAIARDVQPVIAAFRTMAIALVKTVRAMQPMIEAYQRAQEQPPVRLSRRRKRMAIRRERYDQRIRKLTSR